MNDLDDADLAARLRAGFDALAREAGDAPPRLRETTPGPAFRPHRLVLVAAVALLTLAVGALAWGLLDQAEADRRVSTDAAQDPPSASDRPLVGTRWWLVRAEGDGQPLGLGGREDIGLFLSAESPCGERSGTPDCPWTGPTLSASDACNGVSGPYDRPTPGSIELGSERGPTTLMGCSGALVELLRGVFEPGGIGYEITGDQLVLTRQGAVLTYEASDGPFAPISGTVIDEGEVGAESYRLVWTGAELELKVADSEGTVVNGAGLGDDPGRINPTRSEIAGEPYLFAIVPIESTRVVYEPVNGTPQELPIHRVDSTTSSVVGGFVDGAPETWQIVAYDSEGLELHRYRWGDRDDDGAGRSIEEMVTVAGLQDCCTATGARESFTADGTPMSIGSSPIEPTAPPPPGAGLVGPNRVEVPGGGTALTGTVRDEAALRFDCAQTRYEIRAPLAATAALLAVAPALSDAAGCPTTTIADL
ncbi:MAG TPA: hypothetical protein VK507_22125 [Iamia sp.]|nr:hypothetical protein [Iamia sp.]